MDYDTWKTTPPDEPPAYKGTCTPCDYFVACECGCGYGFCKKDPSELYYGDDSGCEEGWYDDYPIDRQAELDDYIYDLYKDSLLY